MLGRGRGRCARKSCERPCGHIPGHVDVGSATKDPLACRSMRTGVGYKGLDRPCYVPRTEGLSKVVEHTKMASRWLRARVACWPRAEELQRHLLGYTQTPPKPWLLPRSGAQDIPRVLCKPFCPKYFANPNQDASQNQRPFLPFLPPIVQAGVPLSEGLLRLVSRET